MTLVTQLSILSDIFVKIYYFNHVRKAIDQITTDNSTTAPLAIIFEFLSKSHVRYSKNCSSFRFYEKQLYTILSNLHNKRTIARNITSLMYVLIM